MVGLAARMVELAERFVEEPWQNVLAPEKVTVGVSKIVTTNDCVGLLPEPFVA